MNKTLEGMARASYEKATSRNSKQMPADYYLEAPDYRAAWEEEMKAALLWLADNVTDEMLNAFFNERDRNGNNRQAISAALRAAAGSALEAKP